MLTSIAASRNSPGKTSSPAGNAPKAAESRRKPPRRRLPIMMPATAADTIPVGDVEVDYSEANGRETRWDPRRAPVQEHPSRQLRTSNVSCAAFSSLNWHAALEASVFLSQHCGDFARTERIPVFFPPQVPLSSHSPQDPTRHLLGCKGASGINPTNAGHM